MTFIYAVIKGETALNKYVARRWQDQRIEWTGCFGHVGGRRACETPDGCTVELIDAFGPDGLCDRYYILYMQHPKGEHYDYDSIRHKVYEDIRHGTIKLLNP